MVELVELVELVEGLRRVTFPLPFGIDHVHCYLLRADDGSWTLVDTGLGVLDPERVWRPILDRLDGPLERIVITHLHPDHVGGAADVAGLSGATVLQGRLDYEQTVGAWGDESMPKRSAEHMLAHGMPSEHAERMQADSTALRPFVRFARSPELLDPGDRVAGWEVLFVPGHADGHIALLRGGVMIAGDSVLGRITPTVGLYQQSRPDPLRDYLESLDLIEGLAPRVAFAGHESTIDDPVTRVEELREHHRQRVELAAGALGSEPRSAYEISLVLFPTDLALSQRRFALAETLAHLERLVHAGRAVRVEEERSVGYTLSS